VGEANAVNLDELIKENEEKINLGLLEMDPSSTEHTYDLKNNKGNDFIKNYAEVYKRYSVIGFQELTDRNLMNTMKDNTLPKDEVNRFFRATIAVDENNLIDSTSTCDYKSLDLSTWNNVCLVMNSKTLEIYLNGKLVKSCVYHSYFRVDNSGLKVSYLQQQANFDGYLSRIQLFNNVLNPDEIYKNYLQGPDGKSITSDPLSFLKYIFTS
jgi:hypothetical protein